MIKNRWGLPLLTLLLIIGIGLGIHYWADNTSPLRPPSPAPTAFVPTLPADKATEIGQRFEQGVAMLHSKQYEYAATAFDWVLQQAPDLPEAHINMGFALLGMEQPKVARDFFQTAISLRSTQLNGYYGLALALAALNDLEGARGAMRTFIHLTPPTDPFLAKARTTLDGWTTAAVKPISPDKTAPPDPFLAKIRATLFEWTIPPVKSIQPEITEQNSL